MEKGDRVTCVNVDYDNMPDGSMRKVLELGKTYTVNMHVFLLDYENGGLISLEEFGIDYLFCARRFKLEPSQ